MGIKEGDLCPPTISFDVINVEETVCTLKINAKIKDWRKLGEDLPNGSYLSRNLKSSINRLIKKIEELRDEKEVR